MRASRKHKSTGDNVGAALRDAAPPRAQRRRDDLSDDEEEEEGNDEEDEEGYGRAWSELSSPHPSAQFGDVRDDDDGDDDDEDDDGGDDEDGGGSEPDGFMVHRVVGARKTEDGSWQYRVRWAGWDADTNTWEPSANLASVTDEKIHKQMERAREKAEECAEKRWLNKRANGDDVAAQAQAILRLGSVAAVHECDGAVQARQGSGRRGAAGQPDDARGTGHPPGGHAEAATLRSWAPADAAAAA